ncbi:MAG: right-handed parallel beta-helix repeat-containing protein [Polyangiaceae bacterium]
MQARFVATLTLLFALGCSGSDSNDTKPDAAHGNDAAGGANHDGGAGAGGSDASADGSPSDGSTSDGSTSDGSTSDGSTSDAGPGPTGAAGAVLPIDYSLSSLTGTVLYVATNGSDSNPGTAASPLATVAAALGKVGANQTATIVVRGGEYREGKLNVPSNRHVRIIAYPKETPVFSGSQSLTQWTTEGSLAWHSYTPQPVTDGSGISFTSGQNLTGNGIGKYPDQAWVGATELQQVATKAEVAAGKFWVDAANARIYLLATDAAKPSVEASQLDRFIRIQGSNSSLEGLRIMRFSNSADDYGVILFEATADDNLLRHVELIDPAFHSIVYAGQAANFLKNSTLEHVTIDHPNWMGLNAAWCDDLVLDSVRFVNANPFAEFTSAPQSGAIKVVRCERVTLVNSEFSNNHSHGVWFDQSNRNVTLARNLFSGNRDAALFFEISDGMLLIDNYISSSSTSTAAVKLAGSSGLELVNNTILGGTDPVGVYTDSRSKPGCADPTQPVCAGSASSERDSVRAPSPTMDWMPRVDLMLNNVLAHPGSGGLCGTKVALCLTSKNSTAYQPIEAILHPADLARGILQTWLDGNVYVNGSGALIRTEDGTYSNLANWTAAAAAAPIFLTGTDVSAKAGAALVDANGLATSQLNHDQAVPIPIDGTLNKYIPAGTKRFGVGSWYTP